MSRIAEIRERRAGISPTPWTHFYPVARDFAHYGVIRPAPATIMVDGVEVDASPAGGIRYQVPGKTVNGVDRGAVAYTSEPKTRNHSSNELRGYHMGHEQTRADGEFIAHAPDDIDYLLSQLKDGGAEARQLIQDLASFPFDVLMDENAPRVAMIGSVSTLRHMQARAQEIIATAPAETSARCGECGHFDGVDEAGVCRHLTYARRHPAYRCKCECVFPASTEQAGERVKTEMPSPQRMAQLIAICDKAACDESAEYVLAATLTGAADEAGITPDGEDFETRCNQRKVFTGRVIEILRQRCMVDPVEPSLSDLAIQAANYLAELDDEQAGYISFALRARVASTTTPTSPAVEAVLDEVWRALRDECCKKPDEAKTVVFLGERKFRDALTPVLSRYLPAQQPEAGYMHEDQLPADMPKEDYDKWYERSWLSDGARGVRVGPRYPFERAEVERLKGEVERLQFENELCRRAFETDDLLRIPEVGNLNALQIVKKLAELSDRLATARADAIGEANEQVAAMPVVTVADKEYIDRETIVVRLQSLALEQLKEKGTK